MSEDVKVVCAWCGHIIKDGIGPVSHGICKTCEAQVEEELYEDKEMK